MSQNLFKRIVTSIVLLLLFFLINFTGQHVFILSILILGIIICIEANRLISKLVLVHLSKKKALLNNFNFKFLLVNNFEKRLLASIQIIKPMIKIEKIKIYW